MKKEIKKISQFVLTNEEFVTLNNFIENYDIVSASYYVEELILDREIKLRMCSLVEKEIFRTELNSLIQIENLIFNLYMERDYEKEQIK